jgi:hypothetical protein
MEYIVFAFQSRVRIHVTITATRLKRRRPLETVEGEGNFDSAVKSVFFHCGGINPSTPLGVDSLVRNRLITSESTLP